MYTDIIRQVNPNLLFLHNLLGFLKNRFNSSHFSTFPKAKEDFGTHFSLPCLLYLTCM